MKKSTLFVSAALTAFVLAILAGVVMTFNNTTKASDVAPATAIVEVLPTAIPETPTTAPTAAPTAVPPATPVSPQDAAGIASQFMNKQDVYSVESATLDGANVYKVTFSSGDIVYVGLDGKVISTTKLQPVVVTNPVLPTPKPHKKNNNNGGGGGGDDHKNDDHGGHDD